MTSYFAKNKKKAKKECFHVPTIRERKKEGAHTLYTHCHHRGKTFRFYYSWPITYIHPLPHKEASRRFCWLALCCEREHREDKHNKNEGRPENIFAYSNWVRHCVMNRGNYRISPNTYINAFMIVPPVNEARQQRSTVEYFTRICMQERVQDKSLPRDCLCDKPIATHARGHGCVRFLIAILLLKCQKQIFFLERNKKCSWRTAFVAKRL